jgi:hypothetical protein
MSQATHQPNRRRVRKHVAAAKPQQRKTGQHPMKSESHLLSIIVVGCLGYIFYTEGALTKIVELLK